MFISFLLKDKTFENSKFCAALPEQFVCAIFIFKRSHRHNETRFEEALYRH